jgi:predicted nucleotidyltransferase
MRKRLPAKKFKRPVDALFSKTRRGVLAATYGQPHREWYLSEIAAYLKTAPSSLQRELETLSSSGILKRRKDGNRLYYQADSSIPIFPELRGIVEKALGVGEALRESLGKFGERIRCAFIYGSVADNTEHALSDVDLMVVGELGLSDLSPALRRLEEKFRREINATIYSPGEFRKELRAGNHFLTDVKEKPKVFVKGGEDELAAITGG